MEFLLGGFDIAAPYRGKESRKRIIVPLEVTPVGITQFAGQRMMNVGRLDLCRHRLIAHSGKAWQLTAHTLERSSIRSTAKFQDRFGFFSKLFEIDGIRHSTTSSFALVRTLGLKVRSLLIESWNRREKPFPRTGCVLLTRDHPTTGSLSQMTSLL